MGNIVIAPVGENSDALFVGIREFPTEKIVLLSNKSYIDKANSIKKDLEKFKIPVQIKEMEGELWESTFKAVADIKKIEGDKDILINVATGDRIMQCATTSAAFVNGIKAFNVAGDKAALLPVLKFNYYRILTDKKLDILKFMYKNKCCASLDELSKKTKMSLPLVSYHINGNLKSEGLKELGLVETSGKKRKVEINLTRLGKLLIEGYIS